MVALLEELPPRKQGGHIAVPATNNKKNQNNVFLYLHVCLVELPFSEKNAELILCSL